MLQKKSVKKFYFNEPAINMTVVGFGQAGSRIADVFAGYTNFEKNPVYQCFAFNSNDGDLEGLKNIPAENRVSLGLGGFGKDPQRAVRILEENKEAREKLNNFIRDKIRVDDDLVLFCAGLGGGTGTATIVKAIEEFYDHYTKPLFEEKYKELIKNIGIEKFRENKRMYLKEIVDRVSEEAPKIGVIVTLPLRADGAKTLRIVNDFAQRIWELANDASKGVAFVLFADNQYFYDLFNELPVNLRAGTENHRDYANFRIAQIFHELNTAATGGGSDVQFDKTDFKKIILNNRGALVINRKTRHISNIQSGLDLEDMFLESIKGSIFHEPVQLINKNGELAEIYDVGLISIFDKSKENAIGTAFTDNAKVQVQNSPDLFITGQIFSGYLAEPDYNLGTVYTFFKTKALPKRLTLGLAEEYEEFMRKKRQVKTMNTSIKNISQEDSGASDLDFDVDKLLSELGFDESGEDTKNQEETQKTNDDYLEELKDIDLKNLFK